MLQKRTDLALEVHELHGERSGIIVEESVKNGITVTTAAVTTDEGERLSGKPKGKYITLDVGKVWMLEPSRFELVCLSVAAELEMLIPHGEGCVLVVGLGNEQITPDSLGPRAVKKLLVTRHIKNMDSNLFNSAGFGCLSAISPGVLGQTGIETAEIVKNLVQEIKPKCVILIDALASRRLNRLATTVQLSDTGISPGSGVSNKRAELSEKTLGVPVVSLGVPTVVDAATLAYDILEEHNGTEDQAFAQVVEKIMSGEGKNMFVTPKDNDIIAQKTALLLANAINMAVHKMNFNEVNEFID